MSNLLIIGAGGYSQLAKEITEISGYEKIAFLSDNYTDAISKIKDVSCLQDDYESCIIAVGNSDIWEKISEKNRYPITLIHPSATVSRLSMLGDGYVVEVKIVICTHATIRKSIFICAGTAVNHDAFADRFS